MYTKAAILVSLSAVAEVIRVMAFGLDLGLLGSALGWCASHPAALALDISAGTLLSVACMMSFTGK